MGFDRNFEYEPRVAVIEFDGPFAGLEIRAALDMPALRQLRLIKQLQALQAITNEGDETQAEEALRQAMELFVGVCDGWNWTRDGEPLPLTAETLLNVIPGNLAFTLTDKWAQTVRGVSAPLVDESISPETSPDSPTPTPESSSRDSTN